MNFLNDLFFKRVSLVLFYEVRLKFQSTSSFLYENFWLLGTILNQSSVYVQSPVSRVYKRPSGNYRLREKFYFRTLNILNIQQSPIRPRQDNVCVVYRKNAENLQSFITYNFAVLKPRCAIQLSFIQQLGHNFDFDTDS